MAKFVVLLRKEIKESLVRQGMQKIRGLHKESLANFAFEKRGRRIGHLFLREHTNNATVRRTFTLFV